MSQQSSRPIVQRDKKSNTSLVEQQQHLRNSRFFDNSTREGRREQAPYAINQSQFARKSVNNILSQNSQRDKSINQSQVNQEFSQNSRKSEGVVGKIKSVVGFVKSGLNILFGSQSQSQDDKVDKKQKLNQKAKMEEELDPDDNLCDDDDQLDFSNLNIPNDRFNIRNKEENKVGAQIGHHDFRQANFSFQQSPQHNSLAQSKADKIKDYQFSSSNFQYQSQKNNNLEVLAQSSANNFNNAYLIQQNQLKNTSGATNRSNSFESERSQQLAGQQSQWTKYNKRQFRMSLVIPEKPRKGRLLNCVKVIAMRTPILLATADNQRDVYGAYIQSGRRDQIHMPIALKPKNIKTLDQLKDYQPFKRKKIHDSTEDQVMNTQSQQSHHNQQNFMSQRSQLNNQNNQRRAKLVDDDNDAIMLTQSNQPSQQTIQFTQSQQSMIQRNQQPSSLADISEQKLLEKLKAQKGLIQNLNDEESMKKVKEIIEQQNKEFYEKQRKELEQSKNKYLRANNSGRSNELLIQQLQQMSEINQQKLEKRQQEEKIKHEEKQQKILDNMLEEMKKLKEEMQLQSQRSISQQSQQSQQQQNITPLYDTLNEMMQKIKNIEMSTQNADQSMRQNSLMSNPDGDSGSQVMGQSLKNQNSNKSDMSLTDLISSDTKSSKQQNNNNNFKIGQQNLSTSVLPPIKEVNSANSSSDKEEKKQPSFVFNPSQFKQNNDTNQSKMNADKSPSFGDKSEINHADSFISESLSTPGTSPKNKKEEQAKPPQFQLGSLGQDQGIKKPEDSNVNKNAAPTLPVFKFNIPAQNNAATTNSATAPKTGNINPFLTNQQAASTSNPTVQATNPFLQPQKASNPFQTGSAAGSTVSASSTAAGNQNSTGGSTAPTFNPFVTTPVNTPSSGPSNPFLNNNGSNNTNKNQVKPLFAFANNNNSSSSGSGFNNPLANSSFNTNNQNKPQGNNPFVTGSNSSGPSNPFGGNNNSNTQGGGNFNSNNAFGSMNNNNNSNGSNSNNSNPFAGLGTNNSNRPSNQPFNNATNFQQQPQNSGNNPWNGNGINPSWSGNNNNNSGSSGTNFNNPNPFSNGSNGGGNNMQNSSFNTRNSNNPFTSGGQNNNGGNPFTSGGGGINNTPNSMNNGGAWSSNNNNNNGSGGGFNIGRSGGSTNNNRNSSNNAPSNENNDDLFGNNTGRKIYRAKRNM
eukprot:403332094